MGLTVQRSLPDNEPWFAVARSTAQHGARNDGLSFEARGVLIYLLSKPGDWVITVPDIMAEGRIGRDKTKKLLAELRRTGYIVTEMTHDKTGKFAGKRDVVYSMPYRSTENPLDGVSVQSDNRSTEKPSDGKSSGRKSRNIQNTDSTQDTEGTSMPAAKAPAKRTPSKRKPKAPPRSDFPEPDVIYEAVETHVFQTQGTPDMPYQWSGRIGQIASWLKGAVASVDGIEVGKISRPAEPHHIQQFVKAWRKQYSDAPTPRKPALFVEHWREWASKASAAHKPIIQLQEASPEDRKALIREVLA